MKQGTVLVATTSVFLFASAALMVMGVGLRYGTQQQEWFTIAQAAAGMPKQDGGTITYVQQGCVIEDPILEPNICNTCPACTVLLQSGCAFVEELQVTSQNGTTVLCPRKGFPYMGGGTVPRAGTQYIFGGASEVAPWIIGIPK